jgi:hypothetical protein
LPVCKRRDRDAEAMARDEVGDDHVLAPRLVAWTMRPACAAAAVQPIERACEALVEAGSVSRMDLDRAQMPSPALTNSGTALRTSASAVPSGFANSGWRSCTSPW